MKFSEPISKSLTSEATNNINSRIKMKELKTKYRRYHSHQEKQSILKSFEADPNVVDFSPSSDAIGGGGYVRYQILEDKK